MNRRQPHDVIDTIEKCNRYFGVETLHPMVSIIDLSQVRSIDITSVRLDLYAVVCAIPDMSEGKTKGHVRFFAPGRISYNYAYESLQIGGWILIFHPDLLIDSMLAQRMTEYSLFDIPTSDGLALDDDEISVIKACMLSLREELKVATDRYSSRILISGISVLLSICMRYAERHTCNNSITANNVVARLNTLLNYHLMLPTEAKELPSVAFCARELNISANYLGDLVRKQTGYSALDYIQRFVVNEVKRQLVRTTLTINQIAYNLGFKYPHHLTRMFRRIVGLTPSEFRESLVSNR